MSAAFVDHYEVLGCSPDTSGVELKKAYHEKLREFHPDKRPDSRTGRGAIVTQAILDAWEILQDPEKRQDYDISWRKQREPASNNEKADALRREGNELYKEGQAVSKAAAPESLSAAARSLQRYQAAIEKYSEALRLTPQDHRILSNRALCYSALKDWSRCREDASFVVRIKPDFMKGWFLLVKALWREGDPVAAQRKLELGLDTLPGCPALLALQEEIAPDLSEASGSHQRLPHVRQGRSRNVSPTCTPGQSRSASVTRVATPPPVRGASKSPGAHARGRESSRTMGSGAHAASGPDFGEQTAKFGDVDDNRTGASSHASQPPTYAERSHGPCAPARPSGGQGTSPNFPTQPPPPPAGTAQGPRQRSSLAGMAASSRLGISGA
eukprot:TRINITY_DN76202_c0_g1_i1.p1 TRINITY_DN76202_c0_g1~~TRINITY_DN76202_c0_g1_i1.p1  ORF type:complete len:384 (-),score=41.58 TRINITY_DN76202_c0_g1_i1:37-1188(-)